MLTDTLPDLATEIIDVGSLTINDIARQFSVSPSTVFRWIMRGLPHGRGDRIRLAAIRRGKVWVTSRAALQRFLAALPASTPTPTTPPIRTPSRREKETTRAQQALKERYGI